MALLRFVELLACVFLLSVLGRVAESRGIKECDKPADIVFVLDASTSIYGPDFRKLLKFVETTISDLPLDPSMVRCGLVTYGEKVREEFDLRTYSSSEAAINAVAAVNKLQGNTRTDLALNRMRKMLADDKRPGVPQIGILFTDGGSDYPAYTRNEAELVHNEGIIMYAVGIGRSINQAELSAIASREDYKYSVDNFDGLGTIRGILKEEKCDEPNEEPRVKECPDKLADVMFVVDGSTSIYPGDFKHQLEFLSELVDLFQVSETGTHVGVITFGDNTIPQFGLDSYSTVAEVQDAIGRIVQQNGRTNTADALRHVREISFTGSRADAIKIAVIITDGDSNEPESTAKEAALLKEAGVAVYAIGVGSGVKKTELHAIASSPLDQHVFTVESYEALESIKKELVSSACLKQSVNEGQRSLRKSLRMLQLLSEMY